MENELDRFRDIPMAVNASLKGPTLRIGDLLALKVGSLLCTRRTVGESVDIFAAEVLIGSGALDTMNGRAVARMVKVGK